MRVSIGVPPRLGVRSGLLMALLVVAMATDLRAQPEAELRGAVVRVVVEAVRESLFRPGSQRGRAVKVRFSLPVAYVLDR